jgi:hypothetical protein
LPFAADIQNAQLARAERGALHREAAGFVLLEPIHLRHGFGARHHEVDLPTAAALVEASVRVALTAHDSFLVEGPESDIADIARFSQGIMERAGQAMFGLPFKAKVQLFPDRRFKDDRPGSRAMWERINRLLRESEAELGAGAPIPMSVRHAS